MKRCVLVFFLFAFFSGYSQSTINNYKYVLLPQKFSFLKESDQYSLNSITKALLVNKGFVAFFDNEELPMELATNKCSALYADLLEKGGVFTTSITLVLKDCHGNIVFKSKEGKSQEKEYGSAYIMALKDASTSFNQVPYTYNGSTIDTVKPADVATNTTAAPVVPQKQIAAPAPAKTTDATPGLPATTLYAQPISNGYQLVDTTPKKVLTLLKTSAADYFIAGNDTFNGIVFKVNNDWFFEYYSNGKLISEKLVIKF